MQFRLFIAVLLTSAAVEAGVRFSAPIWRPNLGLSVPGLVDAAAEPVSPPQATSFLVRNTNGESSLEDRFDTFDLWTSLTVRGRWRDAAGNSLTISRLTAAPPDDTPGTVRTRRDFLSRLLKTPLRPKDKETRDAAVLAVSPFEIEPQAGVRPRRAQRRNMTEIWWHPCTNENASVWSFRPRSPERKEEPDWYVVTFIAAPGSGAADARARFEETFLEGISIPSAARRNPPADTPPDVKNLPNEADLLRKDIRCSVANYDDWNGTDAEDVTIIDNLSPGTRESFITSLTNALPRLRRAYAATVPTPLSSAAGRLAVVRVFRSQEEYLAYVGEEQKWSAALWSPIHRELVLFYPENGTETLLRTVWHEAFHQYLAYATALVDAAPWFNEGHAELFKWSHIDRTGKIVCDKDPDAAMFVHAHAARLAELLPTVMTMDYPAFYAGSQEDRQMKYRLAWSLAYFLEEGAPQVRFRPYEDLRADYVKALIRTRSAREADTAVFTDAFRVRFIADWLAFWKKE